MKANARASWQVYLRSALFLVVLFPSILLHSLLMALVIPFNARVRIRFANVWVHWFHFWLKRSCGLGYTIEGKDQLPREPAVILSRHSSAWETMAFQTVFPPYAWILKRELLWIPIFGWALAMLRPIAIDRTAGHYSVDQIVEQGRERLDSGLWVMCFPETTRMGRNERRRFGMGGAVLAAKSGARVVPVAHNAGCYWRRRAFLKLPGTIAVCVGDPIDPQGLTPEQINAKAKAWIDANTARLESSVA